MRPAARLGLLASLYFSQGLPYGFFAKGLPALMALQGVSLEGIGLTSLLFLPWALKFVLGPVVDGRGRRKAWIVPLQLVGVVALCLLAQLSLKVDFGLVMALVAVVSIISASQDVATDALAVELLRPAERGAGNAVQVGAYRVGMVLSGGVLLMFYGDLGWEGAFVAMAAGLLLATVPVLRYREPPRAPAAAAEATVPFLAALRGFLARPGAAAWLGVLLCYKTFDALPGRMVGPMLVKRGYDIESIGTVLGTLGSVAALVGAVLAAWWMRRLARVPALLIFGLLQLAAVSLYLLPAAGIGDLALLYVAVGADELFGTVATVALFATMMDACRPGWAATDYTVQACLVVVATGASAAVGGFVAARLGFTGLFAVTSGLTLLGWFVARHLLRRGVLDRLQAPEPLAPVPGSV